MPDRIQREVEELLKGLDTLPPPKKKPLSKRAGAAIATPFRALSSLPLPKINAGHVLLFAMFLIAAWWIAGDSDGLWTWVIVAGVGLFIAAFVLSLRRQSKPPEKYWRDRPMELRRGNSWWDRWRNRR